MTPIAMQYKVPYWENDYKQLKRMRWIRNQIAHDNGAVECEPSDLDRLKDFHNRLLKQQDSLAVAQRIISNNMRQPAVSNLQPVFSNYKTRPVDDKKNITTSRIVLAIAAVAIIGIIGFGLYCFLSQ